MKKVSIFLLLVLMVTGNSGTDAGKKSSVYPGSLPQPSIDDFIYKGAFIMDKKTTYGDSVNK